MDILRDISNILKDTNDKEHNLSISVDMCGVTVYLEYDPDNEYNEKMVIPIRFNAAESFTYIPHDKLMEKYKADEYGIEYSEILLISKIMEYFEKNKEEICDLCIPYDAADRNK